ncbi:sulfotransferase [Pseudoalteromonas tunicata]|jgi:hypothetical protein|uniref:Putative orphan protein n=1 Tax=Pseudoalteromonas tunicata D2 TaxID=87626 RepID=A4C535_9GAMM|nr:sulfotransferase [Pseudoalteromonas tunicata]ATC96859.1 hypothetical protein PTUN_b0478 [Pseudoalteromonas tunicata]AXT32998.1 sulfotransferase family protein [Pseudoalteromonas tunicata]EAR30667.1 putative orphan protein [Pseudoalteromonas tunicata D2]
MQFDIQAPQEIIDEPKIFIIGLPRTATTSVCVAMLQLGYRTAHTAYVKSAFEQAQVMADTPIFCDYQALDRLYPGAKFIYLERELVNWLPSIKQLLLRMSDNLLSHKGGFNPIIKRCFKTTFSPFTTENISSDAFLAACYQRHFNEAKRYFNHRPADFLSINVTEPNSFTLLSEFLQRDGEQLPISGFEKINIAGKVTAWNEIKHPLKIASTRGGKIDKLDLMLLPRP